MIKDYLMATRGMPICVEQQCLRLDYNPSTLILARKSEVLSKNKNEVNNAEQED